MKNIAFSLLLFFTVPIFCMEIEKEKDQASETTFLVNAEFSGPIAKSPGRQSSSKYKARAVKGLKILGKGIDRFEQIIPYYLGLQNVGLGLEMTFGECPDTAHDEIALLYLSVGALAPQFCCDYCRPIGCFAPVNESGPNESGPSMLQKCLKPILRNTIPYAMLIFNLYVAYQLSHTPDPPSCNTLEDPSGYCKLEEETHESCNILEKTGDVLFWSSLLLIGVKLSRIRKLIPRSSLCPTLP